MTLDEAIERERRKAEEQRIDNENCEYKAEYGCKGCADYYSKPCIECAEEQEQLVEWLEELKCYKNDKDFSDYADRLHKIAFNSGYNKALEDFVNACKEDISCQTFGLHINGIERIAEQLKEGGENE